MYIDTVPNRGSPPAILLRDARREGKKIVKRTLANLSAWPKARLEALRALLHGEALVPLRQLLRVQRSLPHGHVAVILRMIRRLGLAELLASQPSRQRDLVLAMLVERLVHPRSKLACTRHWQDSTLAATLGVADAEVEELYGALDWLLARQSRIERKLAARHLSANGLVCYDLTSSYYTGQHCPLARHGHDRDGQHGWPIIVYGVLTDRYGRPAAVQVYPGNTGDPATVADQAEKVRDQFGLSQVILVGDRGMLTQARIAALKSYPGLGWISALGSPAIRALVDQGHLQLSLFDRQNLAEIQSPEFPGERLMACFNPLLAAQRRHTRGELLGATEQRLTRIAAEARRRTRTPWSAAALGVKVGRVFHRYKMGKHFQWDIQAGVLRWSRRKESIRQEEDLDGIYVIRTSAPVAEGGDSTKPARPLAGRAERWSAADTVRSYKGLAAVERAFRCLKGLDLRVRPIFHRTADHVRAHIFLGLLAYYVEWHLRGAWAELLFADEALPATRPVRDPVLPAQPSASARAKKRQRQSPAGDPVHSFETLLAHLATQTRNTCRLQKQGPKGFADVTVEEITEPTALQARAAELVELFPVDRSPN